MTRLLDQDSILRMESLPGYSWEKIEDTRASKLIRPDGTTVLYKVDRIGSAVVDLAPAELRIMTEGRRLRGATTSNEPYFFESETARLLASDFSEYKNETLGHENIVEVRDPEGGLAAVVFPGLGENEQDLATMVRTPTKEDKEAHRIARRDEKYANRPKKTRGRDGYIGQPLHHTVGETHPGYSPTTLAHIKGPIFKK